MMYVLSYTRKVLAPYRKSGYRVSDNEALIVYLDPVAESKIDTRRTSYLIGFSLYF
jgi:hypothetical protein